MPPEAPDFLKVGERISYLENAQLAEIIPLPADPSEREKVIHDTTMRLKTEKPPLKIISGSNLSDVEEIASRCDPNVLYLFRS
jgi:hypothetical protein